MPYTSPSEIERQKALAQNLSGFQRNRADPTGMSGLAQVLNQAQSGHLGRKAASQGAENEEIQSKEMQQLLSAMTSGGELPEVSHPASQALVAQLALTKAKANTPASMPSNIAEWQAFEKMTPDQQTQFLNMKRAVQTVNQGDQTAVINPVNPGGAPQAVFETNLAPSQTTDHLQDVADIDTSQAVDEATQVGAVELEQSQAEYEQNRANELAEQEAGSWAKNTAKSDQVSMLSDLIGQARESAGIWTTGLLGSGLAKIAGTPAYDLQANLATVKANIGFDRLQEMRDNSPTGGALGQVSEMENRLLQAVWGNLEQSQSKEQFIENLDLVEQQVQASWDRIDQAYQQDYGTSYFGERDIISEAEAILAQ